MMPQDDAKLLFKIQEAGELLGLSRATINRLIARNLLHALKIGAATRLTRQELNRFVEEMERG